MKITLTCTETVFTSYGVRILDQSKTLKYTLLRTAFVLSLLFGSYGVRIPSIYTKGLSSLFLSICISVMKMKATDIQTLKRSGGIQHEGI